MVRTNTFLIAPLLCAPCKLTDGKKRNHREFLALRNALVVGQIPGRQFEPNFVECKAIYEAVIGFCHGGT